MNFVHTVMSLEGWHDGLGEVNVDTDSVISEYPYTNMKEKWRSCDFLS